MNPEIKQRGVEEIRSQIPRYTGSLRAGINSYSIDGILVDIFLQEKGRQWDSINRTHAMPQEVIEWAGLSSHDPQLPSYATKGILLQGYTIPTLCLLSTCKMRDPRYPDPVPVSAGVIADLIEADL